MDAQSNCEMQVQVVWRQLSSFCGCLTSAGGSIISLINIQVHHCSSSGNALCLCALLTAPHGDIHDNRGPQTLSINWHTCKSISTQQIKLAHSCLEPITPLDQSSGVIDMVLDALKAGRHEMRASCARLLVLICCTYFRRCKDMLPMCPGGTCFDPRDTDICTKPLHYGTV